jgi:hypothetical protein
VSNRPGTRLTALAVVVAAAAGCISTEVKMLGPARPERPADCHPTLFPSRQPDYPFADLAYVSCDANWMLGASACLDELQERACSLGGDTLYGFNQSGQGNETKLAATVAYRTAAAPPPASAEGVCTPICSPGFACQAGRCIPLCNPACGPGEICNAHRLCEPGPPVTAAPPHG